MRKMRLLTTLLALLLTTILLAACTAELNINFNKDKETTSPEESSTTPEDPGCDDNVTESLDPTVEAEPTVPEQPEQGSNNVENGDEDSINFSFIENSGNIYTIYLENGSFDLYIGDVSTDKITFSSSNTAICTFVNGVVYPHSTGTATVTATYGNYKLEATISVKSNEPPVKPAPEYTLADLTFVDFGFGYDYTFPLNFGSFNIYSGNIPTELVTFSTSDASVCTVEDGIVTFIGAGSALITASYNDWTISAIVRISRNN